MRVTALTLRLHNACADQVALFARVFPQGMEVSEDSVLRAYDAGLVVGWAAEKLLPAAALAEFAAAAGAAWAKYDAAAAAAWATRTAARGEYRATLARSLAAVCRETDKLAG